METNKFPNSLLWAIVIVVGATVFLLTRSCNNEPKPSKQPIEQKRVEQKQTIETVKLSSQTAAEKSDSLINLLKYEPHKLTDEDLKDPGLVEFIKNYKFDEN